MVDELAEEADELCYRLAEASRKLEDTTCKLTEIKHQLYDLRQLVLRIGTRLISWEKRESVATLEEEVAETRRFIGTVGGQLWDNARETVEQWRQRNPLESLSD
jgi:chaperonin cofactor prefoldin